MANASLRTTTRDNLIKNSQKRNKCVLQTLNLIIYQVRRHGQRRSDKARANGSHQSINAQPIIHQTKNLLVSKNWFCACKILSTTMKIYSQVLALSAFQASVWGTAAFFVKAPKASPIGALKSTPEDGPLLTPVGPSSPGGQSSSFEVKGVATRAPKAASGQFDDGADVRPPTKLNSDIQMFPIWPEMEVIQGGNTVQTYQMPPWADRCQMRFETYGRPLQATAELWLGPLRTTHKLIMDVEDGAKTPVMATLKFKKHPQVLKVYTSETLDLPVLASVTVPTPERAAELLANTEKVWDTATKDQKQTIQGGSTLGGGGAIRWWTVPPNVESVQILAWSRDSGKKSLKVNIEVLQGPNNIKQKFFLQCGGGSQPYHAVIQTPGDGCVIRMQNKKFLEDGKVQLAVVPYETVA